MCSSVTLLVHYIVDDLFPFPHSVFMIKLNKHTYFFFFLFMPISVDYYNLQEYVLSHVRQKISLNVLVSSYPDTVHILQCYCISFCKRTKS